MDPTTANEYASAPPPPPTYPPPPQPTGFPMNTAIQHGHPQAPTNWSTGLCDCTKDVNNCLITCFCPCVTFGQNADILDRGSPSCGASGALYSLICIITGFQWLYSCFYRTKLKRIYNLPDGQCHDFCVHCFCEPCALCQEYRELKNHGFDMAIGWHANMERQGHGVTEAPMVQGGMIR